MPRASSMASSTSNISPIIEQSRGSKKDRPCDSCRRRKSRCVVDDRQTACVLCTFYNQPCTFLQEPAPRKRKNTDDGGHRLRGIEQGSRRPDTIDTRRRITSDAVVEEYDDFDGPSLLKKTLGLKNKHYSQFIGATNGLEPALLGNLLRGSNELPLEHGYLRRVSQDHTFVLLPDKETQNYDDEIENLDKIEAVIAPHGKALISLYFRIVHPSWPILHKDVFLEKYSRSYREFSSPLLAAVYLLSLHYWAYDENLSKYTKPDSEKLSELARKTLADTIHRPKLSTVQAGLLLLQHTENDTAELTPQLINIGYGLGLHLDSSDWTIPDWEKGLRNRLGWSLYLQDKFSSLGTGKPHLIVSGNWMLQSLNSHDFPEKGPAHEDDQEGSSEVEQGRILFSQMILLTELLTDMLESIFTVRAAREFAGPDGLAILLEKAKPIQLRLKEWFSELPDCLSMENTHILKLSSVGHLRLAYLAIEMTLHRRIVLALSPETPTTLHQICRSAARERFLAAIDFVQSLKPQHLQSFWYFASAQHFMLIATFGSLLYKVSESSAEQDFYKGKLREYRWLLKMHSQNGTNFMKPAIGILDTNLMFLTIREGRGMESIKEGAKSRDGDTDTDISVPNRHTQYMLQADNSLPLLDSHEVASASRMNTSRFQDFRSMTQTDMMETLNWDLIRDFAASVDF